MGDGKRVLTSSLGLVMLLGVFLWFLFVCISVDDQVTTITVPSRAANSKLLKSLENERNHVVRRDYDLNYVSKRRVPNGPDPIHNRLVGKYRQPPGRV